MAKFWDLKKIWNNKKKSRINQEMVNTKLLPHPLLPGQAQDVPQLGVGEHVVEQKHLRTTLITDPAM